MPTCRNCGNHVTKRYQRVFAPSEGVDNDEVRACPECTKLRDGAAVRTARSRNKGQTGEIQ